MPTHAAAPLLLCVLPASRGHLASSVLDAGGTPLVDLTTESGAVPAGAWVRTRDGASAPGTGPVVLAVGAPPVPVAGRETWLETTEPMAAPEGIAGIVLRGEEAGGPCGARPGVELLAKVPSGTRVVLDAGLLPGDLARAGRADGVVLSDVLLALPELALPTRLRARMELSDAAGSHVINGFRVESGPLGPVLRRLLGGDSFWELAQGHFSADDPRERAWPAGLALRQAPRLAAEFGSLTALLAAYRAAGSRSATGGEDAVAIVGLGCRLPGANSVDEFWDNLVSGKSSIVEVPPERWDPALFWDPDKRVADRTYAKIGGFLTEFTFNPRRFRIPPFVAKSVDQVQQTALESAADALQDAGYKVTARDAGRDFDRRRTAVILGNSMGGEVTDDYVMRVRVPAIRRALSQVPGFAELPPATRDGILQGFEEQLVSDLPPITEDSMPGELSNVIAGRVANALDLSGANFTVDAACASSMAAVQTAVKGLLDGDFDMAITGGADRSMGVATYTKFCKIGALSPNHSAPFDETANGFVMGEGCGILVLKRLSDARRDGDRVYSVIKGIGASSDGKGKGITAPNPVGQRLALRRAYEQAGVDPAEVDLIEAHGTSTIVGDKVEVESLTEIIGAGRRGERGPIRIGSVKSNIGHLKSAAGAASLIKTSLAIHHGVLPPSINFENARTDVDFDSVPLQVQQTAEAWPEGRVRRAGVSAFGFGGTNFHVVLEQDGGETDHGEAAAAGSAAPAEHTPLPIGVWAISADSREELLEIVRRMKTQGFDRSRPFEPSAPLRLSAAETDAKTLGAQLDRVIKVLVKGSSADLLRARGVYLEEEPVDGKLAFLFTGQGSQYIDMGLDLAERFDVVRETFAEADRVMEPELGRPLTDYIRRDPTIEQDLQFERLRATEISQPATLTIDIAILRLLAAYGVSPDMVAGHSLGEYAAAVAAGMLSFEDALLAVSARGREMASVKIDDPGRMAGIATNERVVQEVLAEIPGYVVSANKNCPAQTVIAGESDAVEAAIEAFRSRGVTVYPLPVSHAFHSRIVAPASKPLKKVLERLSLQAPRRPITTNVTSGYYPTGPDAAEKAIDILARQVAAPVEWIAQLERMYSDGARVFVECGPKRALSGFAVATFKRRPHRALYTNHPKHGGLASFFDSLAAMVALGLPVKQEPDTGPVDIFFDPEPRRATTAAIQARHTGPASELDASEAVFSQVAELVAELTGYEAAEMRPEDELEADLGVDTVKQAELVARIRDRLHLDHDPEFRLSDYRTLRDLAVYAARRLNAMRTRPVTRPVRSVDVPPAAPVAFSPRRPASLSPAQGGPLPTEAVSALVEGALRAGLDGASADGVAAAVAPALQGLVASLLAAAQQARPPAPAPAPAPVPVVQPAASVPAAQDVVVVATGASVGLPGGSELFDPANFDAVLRGENRIERIDSTVQDEILGKNIVRLVKDPQTGQGTFVRVDEREQVIHLAGVVRKLDVVEDYGISAKLVEAVDRTTQMAFAAAIEALRDAGIPLVRTYHETKTGKKVATGWALPEPMRDGTGIIFCSAFPGYHQLMSKLAERWHDAQSGAEPPPFDRRFLFQVLSMGHSQLAQLIGARGPNTQVNAACASTTQGIAIAQDWLRLGRAERVIIVGADDVTNDLMLPWFGAGFLAAGAATTKDRVEDAALPFDRRRHGMILGAGAVGLVLERQQDVAARGQAPIARLLSTRFGNSAFHGSRLDRDHIAGEVDLLVGEAAKAAGVDRDTFARNAVFMSHETYTPAKGGSAAAEIDSLRHAFGDAARHVVVTNTKGFTGHPMGAGIEDAIVLKAMQRGLVPPVPNLKEPDPDLGELTLSAGGAWSGRYALRLAAGFGSQVALAAWEKVAGGEERTTDARRHAAWLDTLGAGAGPDLVVEDRTLKLVPGAAPVAPAASAPAAAVPPAPAATGADPSSILAVVTDIIAEKTGYGADELDPEYELEADLGIDTVKQAEIFGDVREKLGVAQDPEFRLADYPTIRALSGWLAARVPAGGVPSGAPEAGAPSGVASAAVDTAGAGASLDVASVLAAVTDIIAEKTGYEPSELDPEYELEADLGIDTVKQAEIFGDVREKLGVAQDPEFRLADYPTIHALAGWLAERAEAGAAPAPSASVPPAPAPPVAAPVVDDAAPSAAVADPSAVLAVLTDIIAEKTGYEPSELDPEYELEADLGIDTVKQAEIFGDVREKLGVAQDPEFRLADHPTIEALSGWLAERQGQGDATAVPSAVPEVPVAPPAAAPTAETPASGGVDVLAILIEIVAEKTGYEPAELDPEFELEADLGIDTVKQAEIFGEVRERLGVAQDPEFRLADCPTLEALAGWLSSRRGDLEAEQAPVASSAVEGSVSADAPASTSPPEPALEAAPEPAHRALPAGFRLRRPVVAERSPVVASERLDGVVVEVLGEGSFADALRAGATARGATLSPTGAHLVIDAGDRVEDSFALAKALDAQRPGRWICATRLGADPSWVDPEAGMVQGARAGFAKAIGQEWDTTRSAVVDVDPMLEDTEAAALLFAEAQATDGLVEVYLDGERRSAVGLAVEQVPAEGTVREGAVLVLTGGTRGVTAKVALELARRGPVKLALLARTAPGTDPLEERAAKASIKAELVAAGERATPAQIEARLKPLRRAEEARANLVAMQALGAEVRFYAVDLGNEEAVASTLEQVRVDLGAIEGVIHGAGIEESRLLGDKSPDDFRRVFQGKAHGGMFLVRNLERAAWFVSMGSVAGRFGNAGQVDYSAANEAMARVCLSRPRSLHVDWTAWGDVGMAVRGGMERLLTDRGVEMLPAAAGAALLVDLIAAGATGEIMVAGRLGALSPVASHPLLDRLDFDGDALLGTRTLTVEGDAWLLDHSIGGTAVLPGVMGLELMAAVAAQVAPGEALVGAEDVKFDAPVKVHAGREVTVVVRAERVDEDSIQCSLRSERVSRTGRRLVVDHFSATLRVGDPDLVSTLSPAIFPESPVDQAGIYQRFFHGPIFQVLREAEAVFATGCVALAQVDHAPLGQGLLTGPLLLEAALQTAGLHGMAVHGRMGLPQAIDLLRWDALPADGTEVTVVAHEREGRYDVDIDGPAGSVMRIRGLVLVDTGPLPEPDRFAVPEGGWPEAVVASSGDADAGGTVALLAQEQQRLTARGTPRRQADRLAGQRAAKAAVARLTGLPTTAFTVDRLDSGQPVVRNLRGEDLATAVSISHRDGAGWAVATRTGRVGLDVEAIALRPPSFAQTWFAPEEQVASAGDPTAETEIWCAKEAVLKVLGLGMALHPRDVVVLRLGGPRVRVVLRGAARDAWQAQGGGPLVVRLGRLDGLVAATAVWTPGADLPADVGRRIA